MTEIERIGTGTYRLGEGPLWDPLHSVIYWLDAVAPAIWRYDPEVKDICSWKVPGRTIGSMALREGGGAILAMDHGFCFFDFTSREIERVIELESESSRTRLNDGKTDRQGRFIAGSMDRSLEDPLGALYRLDPNLRWERLDDGVICFNGPCWSPNGEVFYFADSGRQVIYVCDYDTNDGSVLNKRPFVSTEPWNAYPDGATVDSEGFLWTALFAGGSVARFSPDGDLDRLIEVPVKFVTSVMFGGEDLSVLYVTSAGGEIAGERDDSPDAGGVFAVHGLQAQGLLEPRFAG